MNLEEALAKIKELETVNTTLTTENTTLKTDKTNFEAMLSEKDTKIKGLEDRAREQGENFKKFRDMTKEEKDQLSEKEVELLKRQDALEESNKAFEEKQNQFYKDQRASIIREEVAKYAKGDEELAKKIEFNLNRLSGAELAMSKDAIAPLIKDSVSMLGLNPVDVIKEAHNNNSNGQPFEPAPTGFADTPEGQQLSSALFGKEPIKSDNE